MSDKVYTVNINKYKVTTETPDGQVENIMWATDDGVVEWASKHSAISTELIEVGAVQKGKPVVHINAPSKGE